MIQAVKTSHAFAMSVERAANVARALLAANRELAGGMLPMAAGRLMATPRLVVPASAIGGTGVSAEDIWAAAR